MLVVNLKVYSLPFTRSFLHGYFRATFATGGKTVNVLNNLNIM